MKHKLSKFTIHDLAADLALAPGTVSKILNGKGNIPVETRKRVLTRAKEVGYVANHSARVLKAEHTWTIGVVFSDIASFGLEHPFFGSIIQAFKNFIEDKGYEMVFIPKKIGEQEQTYLQWATNKSVDGVLLLTGDVNARDIQELIQADIPSVSVDMVDPSLTTIISDDHQGIELIFKHYLQLGFQTIYAYSGSNLSRAYQQRSEAFELLTQTYQTKRPKEAYFVTDLYGVQHYYEQALLWIQSWVNKPDAIIAFSDDIAMGLIRALKELGYRIPEDISVSGYDDIQFASLFSPGLTTIKQDKKRIAETAAIKLLEIIEKKDVLKGVTTVPVQLMIRQSTKKIK
jgi:LacI family transcriptional regulator